jgi:UDP-N-acetylmuramyl tripeptide synthase
MDEGQPFYVIVDYAHTPDGLSRVLQAGKSLMKTSHGKLHVMFGCGGQRDREKRPIMAAMAEKYADVIVLTQDNPRAESEAQIVEDVLKGFSKKATVTVQNDRRKAIEMILSAASPGDIVILAGKGHETEQVLQTGPIKFDDRAVARAILKEQYARFH